MQRTTQFVNASLLTVTLLPSDLSQIITPAPTLTVSDSLGDIVSVKLPIYAVCGTTLQSVENAAGNIVSVYSNGRDTTTDLDCGDEATPWHPILTSPYGDAYQCVELVRRYYDGLVAPQYSPLLNKTAWRGDATTYWGTYTTKGLTRFYNGGVFAPQKDDILVFQETYVDSKGKTITLGHVAIITTVAYSSVSIIEQNWDQYGARDLSYDPATHAISVGTSKYWVLGWLRSALASESTSALDSGPWPTLAHDNQRTNQSSLPGPATPGTPILLYDEGNSPIGIGEIAVTSDGKIMLSGSLGQVVALNSNGQSFGSAWPFALMQTAYPGSPETPIGITVGNNGTIYVSSHEWPDIPGAVPVHFYSLQSNGTNTQNWPIPSTAMYWPAAIGNDGTIFQMDELQTIHAYTTSGTALWSIGLPNFGQGELALDPAGNVYVGTDSNVYGGHTVYSFTPAGATRPGWPQDTGGATAPTMPAIGPGGQVYIANTAGALYAFNSDGSPRPGFPFASGGTVSQQPLALSSTGIVYMKTSVGLFAINPDGTQVWTTSFSPGGDATLSPGPIVDVNGYIYVAFGDNVYSLNTNGTVRSGWPLPISNAGPIVIGNGVLYVVSGGQKLYKVPAGTLQEIAP
jgi:hypothetical protein